MGVRRQRAQERTSHSSTHRPESQGGLFYNLQVSISAGAVCLPNILEIKGVLMP